MPPLRERKQDIPDLVKRLLHQINEELHTKVHKVSDEAMKRIMDNEWRGNVRELQNILTRAVVLSKSDVLDENILPIQSSPQEQAVPAAYNWKRTLAEVEQEHIEQVLKGVGGNRTEAAKILGISKPTLYSRLPNLGKHDETKAEPNS